jgi:tripartite-type tricarboxylate transporter receptor subunit TctC
VVAFAPGGPVDFVARSIAEALGKELGQQVLVENKAGGNGAIAAELVARAAPDASTLWLTSVGPWRSIPRSTTSCLMTPSGTQPSGAAS